jgi:hypothetical protein
MAHHVYRRPLIIDSPYAPIEEFSPDLVIPQEYASTGADGQILYEDSGVSTIVDATGDPIGGVFYDGAKTAEQTTDADRPVWGGEDVGGQYAGADHLDHDFSKASGDGLTISILFRVTAGLGGIRYLWSFDRTDLNMWGRTQSSNSVRVRTAQDGGTNDSSDESLSSGDLSSWTAVSFAMEESGGTQTYDVKLNSQTKSTQSFSSSGSVINSTDGNAVGALSDGVDGGDGVEIDMPIAVIWKRRLTSTELSDVHDILLGGL